MSDQDPGPSRDQGPGQGGAPGSGQGSAQRPVPTAPVFRQTPNAEKYVLEADAMRRRQLRSALLHGSDRTWREHPRVWPAMAVGAVVAAVIIAGITVADALQIELLNRRQQEQQQQEQQREQQRQEQLQKEEDEQRERELEEQQRSPSASAPTALGTGTWTDRSAGHGTGPLQGPS